MQQLDLLSYSPIARNTDPATSHLAAAAITQDGTRAAQQAIVLQVVREHPGHTAFELTRFCDLDRYQIQRRLSELAKPGHVWKGPIRACEITGRMAVTWRSI